LDYGEILSLRALLTSLRQEWLKRVFFPKPKGGAEWNITLPAIQLDLYGAFPIRVAVIVDFSQTVVAYALSLGDFD